jgi:O-antigen/teichoic acid export membrane protein
MKANFKDKVLIDLIKKGGLNFLFYSLNMIIVYALAIVLTKYYGSAAYGRYSIIKSLILVFIILASLGLNTLVIKFVSDINYYNNKKYKVNFLKRSFQLLALTTFFISSFFYLFKYEISTKIFNDEKLEIYFEYFPLILIFSVFLNYNSNLLKGQGKILLFSFVSSFFNNLIFIFLIFLSVNYYSSSEIYLILSLLISFIIACIYSIFKVTPIKYEKEFSNLKYSKLLKQSLPMMLSSSMIFIIFSVDTLMLGYFESTQNVGIYRIVSQISSLNAIALIILSSVVGPKISNLFSKNEHFKIQSLVIKSSKLILVSTIPIFLFLFLFYKNILTFFGEEYISGSSAIIILSVCQFFYAISGLSDLVLNMTGKQKIFGKITFFTAILNLILNYILIPKYGLTGASIATGISILLTNLFSLVVIYNQYQFLAIYIPFFNNGKLKFYEK